MSDLFPVEIEKAFIGTLVLHPSRFDETEGVLHESDFSSSDMALIFQKMRLSYEAEGMVSDQLMVERGQDPGVLNELMNSAGSPSLFDRNMNVITEASSLRNMVERISSVSTHVLDGVTSLNDARDELTAISDAAAASGMKSPAIDFDEWVAEQDKNPPKWVIPGILRDRERLLFVGPEGMGKSTLNYQLAFTTTCGLHPFDTRANLEPKRVLLVDAENSGYSETVNGVFSHGTPRGMHGFAVGQYPTKPIESMILENLRILSDIGLNLKLPHWRRQMDLAMRDHKPDLVIIGPVYRVWPMEAGDAWDDQAQGFQRYVDGLRRRFGSAFWIEHHAGKNSARSDTIMSYGSSFWERWPEVGRGALPVPWGDETPISARHYRLTQMRGDRGPRKVPQGIQYGEAGLNEWPWHPWEP